MSQSVSYNTVELQLDSFDQNERRQALLHLREKIEAGTIAREVHDTIVNLHCHTFFSYNAYGYSPAHVAWLAYKAGLAAVGSVDFDVLDALPEMMEAGKLLGIQTTAGIETRVFIPEFADAVINSPGEPGIAYHMGVGFPTAQFEGRTQEFLLHLRQTAEERNRGLLSRVNAFLDPVVLDYDQDVIPLTPSGNATERHICLAYACKASALFQDENRLARYWSEKLGAPEKSLQLPVSTAHQALIRSKTMKRGGVGYVQPDAGSFPEMTAMNRFILDAGAIPTLCWLDGASEGEKRLPELVDLSMESGVAAIDVIIGRYTTPATESEMTHMREVINLVMERDLILVIGTEMNSDGQLLFDIERLDMLAEFAPLFLQGAQIVYAHSILQRYAGLGYTSVWAEKHFSTRAERNAFFAHLGSMLKPEKEELMRTCDAATSPDAVLKAIR